MTDEPLIYTKNGNVPIASLRYEHEWVHTATFLAFKEAWYFADGTLARNNVHLYKKPPTRWGRFIAGVKEAWGEFRRKDAALRGAEISTQQGEVQ